MTRCTSGNNLLAQEYQAQLENSAHDVAECMIKKLSVLLVMQPVAVATARATMNHSAFQKQSQQSIGKIHQQKKKSQSPQQRSLRTGSTLTVSHLPMQQRTWTATILVGGKPALFKLDTGQKSLLSQTSSSKHAQPHWRNLPSYCMAQAAIQSK